VRISPSGVAFIKKSEELRLEAYPDPGTGGEPWTIGWGSTRGVTQGMVITEDEAEERLKADLQPVELCIENSVSVPLTQGQHDALCSFVFNLGCVALRNSTLLRKLNAGDDVGAAEEFKRWDHSKGKVLAGLTKRRQAESDMFSA
jgi:lysozyme